MQTHPEAATPRSEEVARWFCLSPIESTGRVRYELEEPFYRLWML